MWSFKNKTHRTSQVFVNWGPKTEGLFSYHCGILKRNVHFSRRESEKNPEVPLQFGKGPGRSLVNAELLGACSQSLPVSDGHRPLQGCPLQGILLFVEIQLRTMSWCIRISQTWSPAKSCRARGSFLHYTCLFDWKPAMTCFSLNLIFI